MDVYLTVVTQRCNFCIHEKLAGYRWGVGWGGTGEPGEETRLTLVQGVV